MTSTPRSSPPPRKKKRISHDDYSSDSDSDLVGFIDDDPQSQSHHHRTHRRPDKNPGNLWLSRRDASSDDEKPKKKKKKSTDVNASDSSSSPREIDESDDSFVGSYSSSGFGSSSSSSEHLSDLGTHTLPRDRSRHHRSLNSLQRKKDRRNHVSGQRATVFHTDGRQICWYDERCYRNNPQHFIDFAHPKRDEAKALQLQLDAQSAQLRAHQIQTPPQSHPLIHPQSGTTTPPRSPTPVESEQNDLLSAIDHVAPKTPPQLHSKLNDQTSNSEQTVSLQPSTLRSYFSSSNQTKKNDSERVSFLSDS
ncbi:hypothetical protein BLNAU_4111 [Blattamonas nauphoetae]|uniref:PBZ-type domain-containing protein n=1 Tax=Blattamonas nauphoetae TaxID=2049346 RepID=A0ABQ9YBN9_9EUKA|nr:hypothetical protein BLNAU_4111 [Blattamonas nauphoetae]